jgi:hypothetical protein
MIPVLIPLVVNSVVNQRNGGRGRWRLSEEFEGMTVNDGDLI